VTAVNRKFVEVSVATTVTLGITAPVGSLIIPEIDPVMAAQAITTSRKKHTLKTKADLFIYPYLPNFDPTAYIL
jgi:hypothetical protein